MAKRKTASEAVAAAQARVVDAGGGWIPKTLMQPDEFAMWERARAKHGSAKDTLLAALRALDGGEPSNAELLALLGVRLKVTKGRG